MVTPDDPAQTQSPAAQGAPRGQHDGTSSEQATHTRGPREGGHHTPQGRALSRGRERGARTSFPETPFDLMRQISHDMDRMMSAFAGRTALLPSNTRTVPFGSWDEDRSAPAMWVPRIDLEQRGDSILVRADLPGQRGAPSDPGRAASG